MPTYTRRRRFGRATPALCLNFTVVIGLLVASTSPALAQTGQLAVPGRPLESLIDLPTMPIEQVADVIVVLRPHADFPLHFATATERIIGGGIDRIDKGVVPQMIVHRPHTIVAPLRAGVPVKLFLKAYPDRNAHYIIGVFPASFGGQP